MNDHETESQWAGFKRELSDASLAAFQQEPLRSVLSTCRNAFAAFPEISIQLRGKTVDVYEGGSRIAQLVPGSGKRRSRLIVARVYLKDTGLDRLEASSDVPAASPPSKLCRLTVDQSLVDAWRDSIGGVIRNSRRAHPNPEGSWEARVMAANDSAEGVQFLDRQVQVPRMGTKGVDARRLDALGVALVDGRDAMIAVELKQGEDPRIAELHGQTSKYLEMLGGAAHALREDIAVSYRKVAQQRAILELPTVQASRIHPRMPVHGLVVLADYNMKSTRLADAADRAASEEAVGKRPIYAHVLEKGALKLPAWPWTALSQIPIDEVTRKRQRQAHLRRDG